MYCCAVKQNYCGEVDIKLPQSKAYRTGNQKGSPLPLIIYAYTNLVDKHLWQFQKTY